MENEINELLEKLIEEKVEDYVQERLIKQKVEEVIEKLIAKEVVDYWKAISSTNNYFKEKINEIMNEPITTDNGWGDRKTYSNFEELFKKTLKSKVDNSYEISNTVKRCVEDRINELIKTQSKELMAKVQEQIVLELERGIKK